MRRRKQLLVREFIPPTHSLVHLAIQHGVYLMTQGRSALQAAQEICADVTFFAFDPDAKMFLTAFQPDDLAAALRETVFR